MPLAIFLSRGLPADMQVWYTIGSVNDLVKPVVDEFLKVGVCALALIAGCHQGRARLGASHSDG